MKYWEIIADKLAKAGWSWGMSSIVDRSAGKMFVITGHQRWFSLCCSGGWNPDSLPRTGKVSRTPSRAINRSEVNMTANDPDDFRSLLIKTAQESQSDYDKSVLLLSGGALGVSIAFVKDIIGATHPAHSCLLLTAWILWGVSCASVLVSYYTSSIALSIAIDRVDREPPGKSLTGAFDVITKILNAVSGLGFLIGLAFFCYFVAANLQPAMDRGGSPQPDTQKTEKGHTVPTRPPPPAPAPVTKPSESPAPVPPQQPPPRK
jgi:hypothetical protein